MCQKVDILLITPPFVQWNCPYPATTVLAGFLKEQGFSVAQADLSIEVICKLFSKNQIQQLFERKKPEKTASKRIKKIFEQGQKYIDAVDFVIKFLQTGDQTMAYRIVNNSFLPQPSKKTSDDDMEWAFGTIGLTEKARYLATLFIEDLGEYIKEMFSSGFGFNRYAESIRHTSHSFEELEKAALSVDDLLDSLYFELIDEKIASYSPKIIGFSIPFPGNLLFTMKASKYVKEKYKEIRIVWGGGYVSTELRDIKNNGVLRYADFICFDDGELPLLSVLKHTLKGEGIESIVRTYYSKDGSLCYAVGNDNQNIDYAKSSTPDYTGIPLEKYISVIEVTNPMHKLWSDGFWNKLVLAHGCYWHQCTFCDTSLDYIKRYEPDKAQNVVDKIVQIIAQTGKTGFHFADEAAPPKLLREVAEELISRNVQIVWWTNIRFEKAFTYELCQLLARSGCIAVSGGLEVASERILKLINKGVTIEQAREAASNFSQNGIMVHAYLMYGFPTQTAKETIDSLEVVRGFFEKGLIQSAYWHRFTMTAHSPIGMNPNVFGVEAVEFDKDFAVNDIEHIDPAGCDHNKYSEGLRAALFNYMNGLGFDIPAKNWFK